MVCFEELGWVWFGFGLVCSGFRLAWVGLGLRSNIQFFSLSLILYFNLNNVGSCWCNICCVVLVYRRVYIVIVDMFARFSPCGTLEARLALSTWNTPLLRTWRGRGWTTGPLVTGRIHSREPERNSSTNLLKSKISGYPWAKYSLISVQSSSFRFPRYKFKRLSIYSNFLVFSLSLKVVGIITSILWFRVPTNVFYIAELNIFTSQHLILYTDNCNQN